MIREFDSKYTPEENTKRVMRTSMIPSYDVESHVKNDHVILKGGRDYSTGILVLLIVVGLLLFVIGLLIAVAYYWTRPYKKIIIAFEPTDTGSLVTITSQNQISDFVMYEFEKELGKVSRVTD